MAKDEDVSVLKILRFAKLWFSILYIKTKGLSINDLMLDQIGRVGGNKKLAIVDDFEGKTGSGCG